nr:GntR family transcriptional regulator [uncultured Ilyobacter sp.]
MTLKLLDRKSNESNRNYVYRVLLDNIMRLNLKPGEGVSEIEISKLLNVSRTPVREAFIKLSEERLIDVYPQKGSFISHIDLDLVHEGIFMRKTIEREVLLEAIRDFPKEDLIELKKTLHFQKAIAEFDINFKEFFKLDNRFHEIIFRGCKKERIWESIQNMNVHYNRLRYLDVLEQTNIDKVIKQHQSIIEHIENKDDVGIDYLLGTHLTNIVPKLDYFSKKYPDYFKK